MNTNKERRAHVTSLLKKYKDLVEEAIKCPVCLDVMNQPKRIPDCTHVFCQKCLIGTQKAGWRGCDICVNQRHFDHDFMTCHHHFRCPVCRKILAYQQNELEAFNVDLVLHNVINFWNKYNRVKKEKSGNKEIRFFQQSADKLIQMLQKFLKDNKSRALNNDAEGIVKTLNFIKQNSFEYDALEIEATLFKAIHRIIVMASNVTKSKWKNQERIYKEYSRRHESRPAQANLQRENYDEELGLVSPIRALATVLNSIRYMATPEPLRHNTTTIYPRVQEGHSLYFSTFAIGGTIHPIQELFDTFSAITMSVFDF
ncbi:hypothetical protein GJ496_008873 [Pomphorhynchus laevis]|nr:hypothetical protein GJ496_008873 [Pomphorhynchus laevis]